MTFRIGVDGGGTKTECILINDTGTVVARHLAPGCNPNVVGTDQARRIVTEALHALLRAAFGAPPPAITATQLYMSGAPAFWQEFAASLTGFGHAHAGVDSLPILELATGGRPGLVLHAGTGSFVAARAPDGSVHYAGGTGWRFGDPGSGYELGRRAIGRALLELQGWHPRSGLSGAVCAHTQLGDSADVRAITRFFYAHADPNGAIASLAPAVLRLASEGDPTARDIVVESAAELLDLASRVAAKLFPATRLEAVPAGLSGALLTHPLVVAACTARTSLALTPLSEPAIEGVRRLLLRT